MKKEPPNQAARLIRENLASEGRKSSWLAGKIGANAALMSAYLSGGYIPKYERRVALADILGIPALAEEVTWRTI